MLDWLAITIYSNNRSAGEKACGGAKHEKDRMDSKRLELTGLQHDPHNTAEQRRKEESKTYKQMGSFEKWMMNHGLLVEAIELKCRVEAASLF